MKIELSDSVWDIVRKMSDGNVGAMTVLLNLIEKGEQVDPADGLKGFGSIMQLDTRGIYGERLWKLFKDVCQENLGMVMVCTRAVQLGLISGQNLDDAIDGTCQLDTLDLLFKVRDRLGQFDVAMAAL